VQVRVEIVKLNKGDEPVPDIEDVPLDVNAAVRAKSSVAKQSEVGCSGDCKDCDAIDGCSGAATHPLFASDVAAPFDSPLCVCRRWI